MSKCLVTRLSSVVQKDNLKKLGHLVLKIENATVGAKTTNFAGYSFMAEPGTTIQLDGAHFIDSGGADIGNVFVKGQIKDAKHIVVDKTTITLSIFSKYEFKALYGDGYCQKLFGDNARYNDVDIKDIKYCTKIEDLGEFPLCGNIEDLALLTNCKGIQLGYKTISHKLTGDLSKLPASFYGMSTVDAKESSFTYTKGARHGSTFRAISFREFEKSFVSAQDYENYLVAMATNAWDSKITRSYLGIILFNKNFVPTQKMKEALWYLKNKMYKDVGDKTRTEGKYFDIYDIDISDIVADPGWLE